MSDHHSDSRLRSYYAVWIAPPAIAMLAYASLEESDSFDGVQRALFCECGNNVTTGLLVYIMVFCLIRDIDRVNCCLDRV